MTKLRLRLSQLAELPRYLAFVWRACGARIAMQVAGTMLVSAPAILRSGTLRAVDARISDMHPPVRDGRRRTYWARVDFGLFRDILLRRCYWPDDAFVPRAGDVVVDLGANVGAFSIIAAKRMGAGRVIAIEAQEYEHDAMVQNIALNGVGGIVTPLQGFVGSGGVFAGTAYCEKTIDLDAALREYGVTEIALLKVDIEGSEFALFERPQPWLRLVRRIAMEVHPPFGDVGLLCEHLRAAGFALRTQPSATPETAIYLYAERAPVAVAVAA
jgi:hypothetical protein